MEIVGAAIGQSGEDLQGVPLYAWYSDLTPLPDQIAAMESVWLEYGALTYDSPLDPEEYIETLENLDAEFVMVDYRDSEMQQCHWPRFWLSRRGPRN